MDAPSKRLLSDKKATETAGDAGVYASASDAAGAFWHGEAGAASGAAAGLVPFKTRANETTQAKFSPAFGSFDHVPNKPHIPVVDDSREAQRITLSFSKRVQAEKRVKRLKRSVWASGHLHGIPQKGHRPMVCWFVTLTYAKADSWEPRHIKRSVDAFRRWCYRRGYPCKYTWVAEIQPGRLQRTGDAVVHFHAIIWLPVGVRMPHWDESEVMSSGRVREPFWPHGMTNTEKAKAGVGYLMKYLSKLGELTVFPEGLRLYGVGGLDHLARDVRAWYNLPEWVKNMYGVGSIQRQGTRFIVLDTGEVLEPMFRREFIPGGCRLHLLRDYPDRHHSGAYSTVDFSQDQFKA